MNRRTFLKRIGGVLAGIAGLCLLPKKKEVKCKTCRGTGRVWSQAIKEDPELIMTPQPILSVKSCHCPIGIARERKWNPVSNGKKRRLQPNPNSSIHFTRYGEKKSCPEGFEQVVPGYYKRIV